VERSQRVPKVREGVEVKSLQSELPEALILVWVGVSVPRSADESRGLCTESRTDDARQPWPDSAARCGDSK
jgi:hypothetical protein